MKIKIKRRDLFGYLVIILLTIGILCSIGIPKGNPIVYVMLLVIGALSFFFSVHTRLNISVQRNINIFSYVFFFLAPWQQYVNGDVIWQENGLIIDYTDQLYIKTSGLIIVCLIVYNISSEYFTRTRLLKNKKKITYKGKLSKKGEKNICLICFLSLIVCIVSGRLFVKDDSSSFMDQMWNIVMFFPVDCLFILGMVYPDKKLLKRKMAFWFVITSVIILYFPLYGSMARFLLFGTYISILCLYFSKVKYKSYYFIILFLGLCYAFSGLRHLSSVSNLVQGLAVDFVHPDYDAYQIMMTLVKYTDEKGFVFGKNIISALAFLVPRSIWHGKLLNSGGIAVNYYGSWFTNVSSPLFGELYFALGWLGVFIGSILIAYIFSEIDSWNEESHLIKRGTYCIFSGMAIYICRGSLLASISYALALVLSCYFISKIVHVKVTKM